MKLGAAAAELQRSKLAARRAGSAFTACRERYDFLHMDMQSNPVKCYRNFTTLISEGEHLVGGAEPPEDQPEI